MPLDPNIILGAKPVEMLNPLDVQAKALTLKQLAMQNQLANQQFSDDQAMRSAYSHNMTVGPDGTPTVNRQGFMSELGPKAPTLAMQKGMEFQKNDIETSKAQIEILDARHKQAADVAMSIPTDPSVSMEAKQAAWSAAKQKSIQLGLPGASQAPDQYPGDAFVKQMQMHTLSAVDQLKQQNSDRDFDIKSRHESTYEKDVQAKREANATNKSGQALQQTNQMLMSARGDAAYQQANKDYYNAQKANTLANLYGDPNKLSPQQVNLLVSEVGKIATGGVPSMHELDGLTPSTLTGKLAAQWSRLSNNPTPANAGEFVKQYQAYTNALSDDAKEFMIDRDKRVLDSQRPRIGEANYKNLSGIHLDRFDRQKKSSAPGAVPVMKTHEIEWAD